MRCKRIKLRPYATVNVVKWMQYIRITDVIRWSDVLTCYYALGRVALVRSSFLGTNALASQRGYIHTACSDALQWIWLNARRCCAATHMVNCGLKQICLCKVYKLLAKHGILKLINCAMIVKRCIITWDKLRNSLMVANYTHIYSYHSSDDFQKVCITLVSTQNILRCP